MENGDFMTTHLPLPDEPMGWRELQQQALKERDREKLDGLLRCMEQILRKHEYETAKRESSIKDFEVVPAEFRLGTAPLRLLARQRIVNCWKRNVRTAWKLVNRRGSERHAPIRAAQPRHADFHGRSSL